MEFGFDVGDIAKTLGGLMAFVVVLYIGVLFYKKESSFSDEYVLLLQQYKNRNEALQEELTEQAIAHERQIKENKAEIAQLVAQQDELSRELKYLRNLVASSTRQA